MTRSWQASWIWPRDRREPNLHLLFRKDMTLAALPYAAVLHIAVESAAEISINGTVLGRTSANSYPHQHYYETIDCRSALQVGLNRIAIVARYIGIPSSASIPKDPGVLCEIEVTDADGITRSIGSDATWVCCTLDAWRGRQRRSEWLNLDIVEILDRRLLPPGFPCTAGLTGYETPESLVWPGVRFAGLEPRPFPKTVASGAVALRLLTAGTVQDRSAAVAIPALAMSEEAITPTAMGWNGEGSITIPAQPSGTAFALVISLDGYWNGRLRFTASGAAGTIIDVAWHETLTDGRFDVRKTRVYTADRFILADGSNVIAPEDWICGRFMQLTFRQVTAPLQIQGLCFERDEYPLRSVLTFTSSDSRLERIVDISMNAVRRCMHDNIMDCPWRERRQWIGDVQRIALINHLAFGDRALVRAVLRQQVHLQEASGRMWVCVPIWEEYPTQSMEWLRAVLEYQHHTGDRTLLTEVFDNAEHLHRWFMRQRDTQGLFTVQTRPVMNWMDNPFAKIRQHQFSTAFLGQNLRYLLFLDDMATCFRGQGRSEEATRVVAERHNMMARIISHFSDAPTGLLRDCADPGIAATFSDLGHALAVCAGVPHAAALWQRFTAFAAQKPEAIIHASPFGKYHVHQALALLGQHDEIVRDILTCWGPMVDAGADTTWEWFPGHGGGTISQQGSHCHGWAGIPVVALVGMVLGLDSRSRGPARRENVGGVAWIAAERHQ